MVYNINGQSIGGDFLNSCQLVTGIHAQTFYYALRIFKKKTDGTLQVPFVIASNGTSPTQKSALDFALEHDLSLVMPRLAIRLYTYSDGCLDSKLAGHPRPTNHLSSTLGGREWRLTHGSSGHSGCYTPFFRGGVRSLFIRANRGRLRSGCPSGLSKHNQLVCGGTTADYRSVRKR